MPGENLSRDEARERAELLSVDGYDVALDVRSAVGEPSAGRPRTFRSGDDASVSAAPSPAPRPSRT